VEVRTLAASDAALTEQDTPAMQCALRAYQRGFGGQPVFVRSGGTLPVVAMLNKILRVPVIMLGFGLPDDNPHSPNEKFDLDNFYRGINTSIYLMQELAEGCVKAA
jgi:acetylornithine deacetylase/succinyl-diaminopimelate desuccinylase-like protein